MKVGTVYANMELAGDHKALDQIAIATEALGYDHIALYEHVLGVDAENREPALPGSTANVTYYDPFVAFGRLSALTQRINFVTSVMVLPQRQTALVAKQAADVDVFSGGRLTLGVGTGWNYVEYEALGQSFKTRGSRMSEQMTLMRKLWSEPQVSFEGAFDKIDRAGISPRPGRQIPIFCGGASEPAYKRAAKQADGFIFFGGIDDCLAGLRSLREYLDRAGRSADGFGVHYVAPGGVAGEGATQQMLGDVARWRDAGGTHATVSSLGHGLTTAAQHIDYLAALKQRI